ncbi:hypothetical protein DY000_02022159 [Brassica cretica]|uniref:Uncharacterized protein n=1 Tax=Brassica cretica TaxID=69181 RepID=A0ABQ7EBN7_BRACR|nr:hypothetical protein DY000_02022159 [Brassica cretica]
MPSQRRVFVNSCLTLSEPDCKFVPNNKQVQFKLVPKIQVYRTIADPKSCVEIVSAEQVVGLYVRQAMMIMRDMRACAACTASDKLTAERSPLEA